MGAACSTYGGKESYVWGLSAETKGKNHLEDIGVDGRILLKWILNK